MTTENFLEGLLVHFGKRHVDERAQIIWTRDVLGSIRGTDPAVLSKAYTLIVSEHEERAFPLPAVLKKFITRAAEIVYPEHIKEFERIPDVAPPSPEARERVRRMREIAVAAIRNKSAKLAPIEPAPLADVSKPAFEAMQRHSRNAHLHVDQSLARRITGERL